MLTSAYAVINVESSPVNSESHTAPIAPQKAVAKSYRGVMLPNTPDILELDNIEWGARLNGPGRKSKTQPGSDCQTPKSPNDLEMSTPPNPMTHDEGGVDAIQSFSNPPMNRFRMASSSLLNFSNGLSDSAPGALIPYIEK